MARDLLLGTTRRDWSLGSIVLPARQERRILNKVDDVRYDVRQAARRVQAGLLAISGAAVALALSAAFRASGGEPVTLVRVPRMSAGGDPSTLPTVNLPRPGRTR